MISPARLQPQLAAIVGFLATALLGLPARGAHAFAQFGPPKYPSSFEHFDYVNANAPHGGTLELSIVSQNSSIDKLNPFTLKGKPAPGLLELTFETLAVLSLDEPNTLYGLLADDIRVAEDLGSTEFHLRPEARFSNGDRVGARDVEYSFRTLTSKQASPRFRSYFAEIARVLLLDDATVRFEFKRKGRDLPFVAASLPVFSPRWGQRRDGSAVPFAELYLEKPIASGPYSIESAGERLDVVYRKNPAYWGAALPVRKGQFNFERVVYKLYKDSDSQVAALRSADFDFFSETRMRYWCCQFIGKHFDSGELVKQRFPHQNPPAMNGWVLNLRKQRFQDARVRQALNYAFDFEWVNAKILDNEFSPITSYFSNTSLAATGSPGEAELALLEPYRAQLDPAVFGPVFVRPSSLPPASLRANLERAIQLFADAGWRYRDGALRDARGDAFELTIPGSRAQALLGGFYFNLAKLGVVLKPQILDVASTKRKLGDFDFDFAALALREARMPGAELWRAFNSKDADVPGSENIAGVKSPVVDALIKRLLDASSQSELEVAARAVDRVLLHSHYVMPWRYLKQHYFIYNQRLQRPSAVPSYYGSYDWVLMTWWDGQAGAPAPSREGPRHAASASAWRARDGWLLLPLGALLLVTLRIGQRAFRRPGATPG